MKVDASHLGDDLGSPCAGAGLYPCNRFRFSARGYTATGHLGDAGHPAVPRTRPSDDTYRQREPGKPAQNESAKNIFE